MNKDNFESKGEKVLYAVYLLTKEGNKIITVEDVAVRLWEIYKKEFCMKGYPQFPNVDIQKHFTSLFKNNFLKGGVSNYTLTSKGKALVEEIINKKTNGLNKKESATNATLSRELKKEIERILNSKVYQYFLKEDSPSFLELDFYEFLGTSPRTLHDRRKTDYFAKISLIKKDLINYCKQNENKNDDLRKILKLWNILSKEFKEVLK